MLQTDPLAAQRVQEAPNQIAARKALETLEMLTEVMPSLQAEIVVLRTDMHRQWSYKEGLDAVITRMNKLSAEKFPVAIDWLQHASLTYAAARETMKASYQVTAMPASALSDNPLVCRVKTLRKSFEFALLALTQDSAWNAMMDVTKAAPWTDIHGADNHLAWSKSDKPIGLRIQHAKTAERIATTALDQIKAKAAEVQAAKPTAAPAETPKEELSAATPEPSKAQLQKEASEKHSKEQARLEHKAVEDRKEKNSGPGARTIRDAKRRANQLARNGLPATHKKAKKQKK